MAIFPNDTRYLSILQSIADSLEIATVEGPVGPAGPEGPQGPVGPAGITRSIYRLGADIVSASTAPMSAFTLALQANKLYRIQGNLLASVSVANNGLRIYAAWPASGVDVGCLSFHGPNGVTAQVVSFSPKGSSNYSASSHS